MNTTRHTSWLTVGYSKSFTGALALAIALLTSTVFAQSSVQFEIGESALLLQASRMLQDGDIDQTQFDQLQMAESCKNPAQRLQDRNRPWMMVWNTSTDTDDVESVTIDLTEPGFEFGNGDVSGDGFNGFLSILSSRSDSGVSLDSASYGADETELVLNFSGLSPDSAAIFQIDIDEPGGVFMFPDFHEAMLGADTGDGPGQMVSIMTAFDSGLTTLSTFNQSGPLANSGVTGPYHGQAMSMIETSTVIPEPSSIMLLIAGLTGIATMSRYR